MKYGDFHGNTNSEISALSIYSQNGMVLGGLVAERVGKNMIDVETIYGDYLHEAAAAVAEGREFECRSYSPLLGTNVEIIMVPFKFGTSQ